MWFIFLMICQTVYEGPLEWVLAGTAEETISAKQWSYLILWHPFLQPYRNRKSFKNPLGKLNIHSIYRKTVITVKEIIFKMNLFLSFLIPYFPQKRDEGNSHLILEKWLPTESQCLVCYIDLLPISENHQHVSQGNLNFELFPKRNKHSCKAKMASALESRYFLAA